MTTDRGGNTPWWHGLCREIAERVNKMSGATDEQMVTPWQVEQTLLTTDALRSERSHSGRGGEG